LTHIEKYIKNQIVGMTVSLEALSFNNCTAEMVQPTN
jgi:hypothetical protein